MHLQIEHPSDRNLSIQLVWEKCRVWARDGRRACSERRCWGRNRNSRTQNGKVGRSEGGEVHNAMESQDQEGGERSSCRQQRQETTAALARTLTHTHTHAHTQLLEIQPCMPVDWDRAAALHHAPLTLCVSSCFVFSGSLWLRQYDCLLWSCRALWPSNFGPCGDNRVLSEWEGKAEEACGRVRAFSLTLSVFTLCVRKTDCFDLIFI